MSAIIKPQQFSATLAAGVAVPGPPGPQGPPGPVVPATETTLGGVIVGSGLAVDSSGTISVSSSGGAAQTPWLSDIDAGGFNLKNLNGITLEAAPVATLATGVIQTYGSHLSILAYPGYWVWIGGGYESSPPAAISVYAGPPGNPVVGINNESPQYPLDIAGDCNVTGSYRQNGTSVVIGGSPPSIVINDGASNINTVDRSGMEISNPATSGSVGLSGGTMVISCAGPVEISASACSITSALTVSAIAAPSGGNLTLTVSANAYFTANLSYTSIDSPNNFVLTTGNFKLINNSGSTLFQTYLGNVYMSNLPVYANLAAAQAALGAGSGILWMDPNNALHLA